MTGTSNRVAVIGGGVVGVLCAAEMQRAGADVVLLERKTCGGAASWGNAGWIVPSLSTPLSGPGVVRTALRAAFGRTAPLRLACLPGTATLHWIRLLLAHSTAERHRRNLAAAIRVAAGTHDAFDQLAAEGDVRLRRDGLLSVARTEQPLHAFAQAQQAVHAAGYDAGATVVDGEEVRRLEPALAGDLAGGVLLRYERSIDPTHLISAGLDRFRRAGGEVRENTPVHRLTVSRGRWHLATAEATVDADRVVVAAGAWSPGVLARLGVRLPLQAARGCSLTSVGTGTPPRLPVKLIEAQVACSPVDGGVRLSGTYDLAKASAKLASRRLRAVLHAARPYFGDWTPDEASGIRWSGLRPATPDGLPAVGPVPGRGGLFVATGHGTLGVTLAPVTASAVRDMVLADRVPDAFAACGIDRFDRRRERTRIR